MNKIKRRPIADPEAALRAYYGTGYLSNKEIKEIFGIKNDTSLQRLKRPVIQAEKESNIPIVVPAHVNTKIAFKVWDIDVPALERNRKKLAELGL